jgi:hypothetical protein
MNSVRQGESENKKKFELFKSRYIKELNSYSRRGLPSADERKKIYWYNVCKIYNKSHQSTLYKGDTIDLNQNDTINLEIQTLIGKFSNSIDTTIANLQQQANHNINYLSCHGAPLYNFFEVPENLIICFLTPLNRFSHQIENEHIYIKTTLINKKENILTNLECFQDNDEHASYDMFKYATFYYPGQMCIETKMESEKLPDDLEFAILASGLYQNINNETKPVKIVDEGINLSQLIVNNTLTGLLVISCCRHCNTTLSIDNVPILYQYEHFINIANMSLRFNDEEKYNNCWDGSDKLPIETSKEYSRKMMSQRLLKNSSLSPDRHPQIAAYKQLLKKITNSETTINNYGQLYSFIYETIKRHMHAEQDKYKIFISELLASNNLYIINLCASLFIYIIIDLNKQIIQQNIDREKKIFYNIPKYSIFKEYFNSNFENIMCSTLTEFYKTNKFTKFNIYLSDCNIENYLVNVIISIYIVVTCIKKAINTERTRDIKVNVNVNISNNKIDSDAFNNMLQTLNDHEHKDQNKFLDLDLDLSHNNITKIDIAQLNIIEQLEGCLISLNLDHNKLIIPEDALTKIRESPFLLSLLSKYLLPIPIVTQPTVLEVSNAPPVGGFMKQPYKNKNNNKGTHSSNQKLTRRNINNRKRSHSKKSQIQRKSKSI